MKLDKFKKKFKKYPYFSSSLFSQLEGSRGLLHTQLHYWVKRGEVIRLRRGLYTLNNEDRQVGLSQKLLANLLHSPSYVSLEYALSFYDMIPEAVYVVTSVTTKKTNKLKNQFGQFIYKSIKQDAFTGFIPIKDEFGLECLMATPEKALLDFFYFQVPYTLEIKEDFFEESLRLQNTDQIDCKKFLELAKEMNSKKVQKIVKVFLKWKVGEEE